MVSVDTVAGFTERTVLAANSKAKQQLNGHLLLVE
jgi:hypothetical protein